MLDRLFLYSKGFGDAGDINVLLEKDFNFEQMRALATAVPILNPDVSSNHGWYLNRGEVCLPTGHSNADQGHIPFLRVLEGPVKSEMSTGETEVFNGERQHLIWQKVEWCRCRGLF